HPGGGAPARLLRTDARRPRGRGPLRATSRRARAPRPALPAASLTPRLASGATGFFRKGSSCLVPSILGPRSADPFAHVLVAGIGSIARPRHRLPDLQHHDVLAIGYFSQVIADLFRAHVTGPRGDQPKSGNPVPPAQIPCFYPFNERPIFLQGHVFDGDDKSALHCWLSVLR